MTLFAVPYSRWDVHTDTIKRGLWKFKIRCKREPNRFHVMWGWTLK